MFRRVMRVLIALVVATAMAMPVGVYAMPMSASGMTADQPCQNCPQPDQTGNTNPAKMAVCQAMGCAGAMAMLPAPAVALERVQFSVAYVQAPPVRWAEATSAPDPFPPKPIVLR